MAPRLKVFVSSDGLTDFVVATTSRAKALEAWGVRQDIFKEGRARETDDPELVAAATARPGEVLRRPAGTRDELATLAPAKPRAKPKGPPRAALRKIAHLEKQLASLEAAHEREKAGLVRQHAELDRLGAQLDREHSAARAKLEAELSAARQAPG